MKKRVYGLDLVRFIAIFFVILVHSFLNDGFNELPLNSIKMFILLFIRCLSHCGVLLFIILTGYLCSNREINKKHYYSIFKILITYFLVSIITLIFRKCYLNDEVSVITLIANIFNFTTAPYAWYVEMYIGLFFLIPFLNILYKNINTRKNKRLLIITLFLFSSLFPTLDKIMIAGHSINLYPDWWSLLYPILLYYVGSYIREYKINFNKYVNIAIIILLNFLNAFVSFFYSQGKSVNDLSIDNNYAVSIILAILIFIQFYNVTTKNIKIEKNVSFYSKYSFGAYLISYCFDVLLYRNAKNIFSETHYLIISTFCIPFLVLFLSTIVSFLVEKISKLIYNLAIIKIEAMNNS